MQLLLLSLSSRARCLDHAGGVGDLGVITIDGCAWTGTIRRELAHDHCGRRRRGPRSGESLRPFPIRASRAGRRLVTLAGHTVSVTQAGIPCVYSVSPLRLVVSFGRRQQHRGGDVSDRVRVDGGQRHAPWAVIGASSGGGSGNGVMAYSVAAELVRERANGHAHDRRPVGRGDPDRLFVYPLVDQQSRRPPPEAMTSIAVTASAVLRLDDPEWRRLDRDHLAEQRRLDPTFVDLLGGGESRDHGPERDV